MAQGDYLGIVMQSDIGAQGANGVAAQSDLQSAAQTATTAKNEIDAIMTPKTIGPAPIASFTDGLDGAILGKCVVNIEPVQSGSGDPSPTNIRPISGWTGATIKRYGTDESDNLSTYSISFGEAGTVYGGTLDVGTGVLTVDLISKTFSELNIANTAGRFATILTALNPDFRNARLTEYYCSQYKKHDVPYHGLENLECTGVSAGVDSNTPMVIIRDDAFDPTTAEGREAFKAARANAQLVLRIATPVTYQLTPVQVRTLLGLNNIYADCGDVTVQYRGDVPNLYNNIYTLLNGLHFAPEVHRTLFRGKYLGTSLTAEQKAHIQNGTFYDLWLGDYWIINNILWRIVDFDYWYNSGDTAFTRHHLVVMPDNVLYNAQMNESNITTGGYIGSKMYTDNLARAKTTCQSAFGDALLTHRNIFVNAVTNGKASGYAWVDSTVDLPNEIMMYGTTYFRPANDGVTIPPDYTIDKSQLALMQAFPKFINPARQTQWLRDVVSAANFAFVYPIGAATYDYASYSRGVRPPVAVG